MKLPAGVFHIDEIDSVVVDFEWPFAREKAVEIDKNWNRLTSKQPSLFNGEVFLACDWSLERLRGTQVLRTQHFQTEYKCFLAWRDFGFPDMSVANCFASPALSGSDGVYVLTEMAAHTANAGLVYFPCGTPDPGDLLPDRQLDLSGSVMRELEEETGLMHPMVVAENGWTIVNEWPRLACLKDVISGIPGAAVAAAVDAHIANEENPELARAHMAISLEDLRPDIMPGYIINFLQSRLDYPAG